MNSPLFLLLPTLLTLLPHSFAAAGIDGHILDKAFADPCVIDTDNGQYYAFPTNHYNDENEDNVPVAKSDGLRGTWTDIDNFDPLPNTRNWVDKPDGHVWDPDVNQSVASPSHF
jgi:hypothetical protein